jgi:uroporphyrin-III C-methyltransferase / precorrin-2 dehydrogenase / sirohydrochlorin ferrochelatase
MQRSNMKNGSLFPIFLKLSGRKVVLVGGGRVAAAKLESLVGTGAELVVIAPNVRPELQRPGISIQRREFVSADLDGAWLVIAASSGEVNRQVAAAAEERRIFLNAVDDPDSGSAYTGGVLRRGGVTLAISTSGQAPALAGLLREALDWVLPEQLESWVDVARQLRSRWREGGVPLPDRRPQLLEALNRLYAQKEAAS